MEGLPDREALVELMDRAARLDADAETVAYARGVVDALFAAHQDRIYALCLRYLGEAQAARDVAQDTFLTAYRRLADYQGAGSFYAWLYGIARFKCMRALARHKDVLTHDGVLDDTDPTHTVFYEIRRAERLAVLAAAAAAVLDPVEQEAVHLRYAVGMGQDQITEVLGLTNKSGARGLLVRCRRKLSAELRRRLQEIGHTSSFFHQSTS